MGEHRRDLSRARYMGVFDLYEFIKLFICDMYTLLMSPFSESLQNEQEQKTEQVGKGSIMK